MSDPVLLVKLSTLSYWRDVQYTSLINWLEDDSSRSVLILIRKSCNEWLPYRFDLMSLYKLAGMEVLASASATPPYSWTNTIFFEPTTIMYGRPSIWSIEHTYNNPSLMEYPTDIKPGLRMGEYPMKLKYSPLIVPSGDDSAYSYVNDLVAYEWKDEFVSVGGCAIQAGAAGTEQDLEVEIECVCKVKYPAKFTCDLEFFNIDNKNLPAITPEFDIDGGIGGGGVLLYGGGVCTYAGVNVPLVVNVATLYQKTEGTAGTGFYYNRYIKVTFSDVTNTATFNIKAYSKFDGLDAVSRAIIAVIGGFKISNVKAE